METGYMDTPLVVKKYLVKLGYPPESILLEYRATNNRIIDMVVKISDEVLLAVELKNRPLRELVPSEQMGYHPIIRQLQADATTLNAKYYLFSNGREYIWFKTGEDGRPGRISAVSYNHFRNATPLTAGEYLDVILNNVSHYIRQSKITGDYLYDFSILLYCRLLQETNPEEEFLVDIKDILGNHYVEDNSVRNLTETIKRGIEIFALSNTSLLDNPQVALGFIDNLFQNNGREWNLPRWLADLMIHLLALPKEAELLDIFGKNGTMLSSAHLNKYENIRSFCINQKDFYWMKIQQLLSFRKEQNLIFNPDIESLYENLSEYSPSGIMLAPPFDVKITERENSELSRRSLSSATPVFIEQSLRILKPQGRMIVVVPSGFLSSQSDKFVRKYIKRYVECIVHLPVGSFKPHSYVKTSLLILDKERGNTPEKDVLIADLKDIPIQDTLRNKHSIEVTEIINALNQFRKGESVHETDDIFPIKSLKADDFQLSAYKTPEISKQIEQLDKNFTLVPLKDLVVIEKGNSLVRDEKGDIPFINPGVIRQLELKEDAISYTSEEKLPSEKMKKVRSGQVVLNTISTYIGKAALVTDKFDGMLVNRHVTIITPKDKTLHPGYLSIILNSEIVQEQFYNRTSGSVIPSLRLEKFKEVLIPITSLEQQTVIYNEYLELLEELEAIENKKAAILGIIQSDLRNLGKGKEETL